MTDNESDFGAQFEAELAAVEEEQRRVGITHEDLATLFHDEVDQDIRERIEAGWRVFVGPVSFTDQLAVLRSLPDGAGRESFLAAFRAHRVRRSAVRDRDV